MPETMPLVDVEALIVAHLRDDADLVALMGGDDNIGTEQRALLPLPFLEIRRIGGSLVTPETAHIERARLHVATWAESKPAAWDLAARTVVALLRAPEAPHALGVVTAADMELTPYWSPDPEDDTPRYLATCALTVHPR